MKSLYVLTLTGLLFACGEPKKMKDTVVDSIPAPAAISEKAPDTLKAMPPAVNPYEHAHIEVKTFQNKTDDDANGTWGYDIHIDGKPYVHQPSIPAVQGNKGFGTQAKAAKAGEFVAGKIKHNIMPPSVTPHELDSLNVLN